MCNSMCKVSYTHYTDFCCPYRDMQLRFAPRPRSPAKPELVGRQKLELFEKESSVGSLELSAFRLISMLQSLTNLGQMD